MKITFSVLGRLLGAALVLAINPSVTHAQFVGPSAITIDGTFSDWTGSGVYYQADGTLGGTTSSDINGFWSAMSTANGTSPASTSNLIQNVYYRFDTANLYANNPKQSYWVQLNLGTAGAGFADHILQIYVDTAPKGGAPIVSIVLYSYNTPYPAMGAFTTGTITPRVSNLSSGYGIYDPNATGSYAINGTTYSLEVKIPIGWFSSTYGGSITADGTGASMIASAMFTSTGSKGAVGTVQDQLDDASGNLFYSQASATTGSVSFVAEYSGGNAYSATAAAATLTPVAGAGDTITLTVQKNNGRWGISTDTTYTGAHNVTISGFSAAPNGSYGSFNGTTLTGSPQTISVTFTNGVATPSLILNKAATQIIGFSLPDLTYPAANNLSITPTAGTASKLAFTNSPVTMTAGVASGNITVQRQDRFGNPVTAEGTRNVTLSSNSTGTKTFTPASPLTIASGASSASFTYTDTKAGKPTITAASISPTTITSATQTETVNAAAATGGQSTVTASPAVVTADGTTTSTVTVTLKDAYGNPVSGKTVTLAKSSGPGTPTISAASGPSSASGVVTFTVKSTTAGTDVFAATDTSDSVTITQTASVDFTPGAATHLVFVQQPTTTAAGNAISPPVTVYVEDANGNVVTNNSSSVTIGSGTTAFTGGSTLTVAAVNGVATFSGVNPTTAGTANTLTASDGALTGATSNPFTVNAGAASQLVFTSTAVTNTAGVASGSITVQRQDQYGNPNTTDASRTVTLASDSTGTVTFTPASPLTIASGSSSASFTYTDTKAGTPTITAASTSPNTITSATQQETVNAATASKLAYTTVPGTGTAGTAFSVTVQSQDANGNPSSPTSTTTITLSVASGGGTLSGTLTGSIATSGNSVTISTPVYSKSDTMTLTATATAGMTGLTPVTSGNIVFSAGALQHFAISTISSPQTAGTAITGITLTAQDVNSNTVTSFVSTVAYSGTAGITGTSAAFTAGVLSSVSVTPTVAGSGKTFIVTGSTKTGTSTFDVNPGTLDHFAVTTPGTQTAGTAFAIATITAQDANNNTVTTFVSTVALTETGDGAGGTVSPATSSAFTAGVLSGQSVTLSKSGAAVTITATGSAKAGVSGTFLVNPGPMAMPMTVTRTAGLTLKIAWSDVKTNWSESVGGTVTLSGINLVTTNQVHLTTNSTWIFYINSPNVDDQITYTISDGQGRTNTGVINVVINPFVTGQNATVTVSNGTATVTFYGKPGLTYVTQRSTDLVVWVTIATTTVSSSGVITVTDTFSDLGGPPASAYYRLGWSP